MKEEVLYLLAYKRGRLCGSKKQDSKAVYLYDLLSQ